MLERSRVTARIAEVREARDIVESYAAVFGEFPASLDAASAQRLRGALPAMSFEAMSASWSICSSMLASSRRGR